jgi:hypothetical protein
MTHPYDTLVVELDEIMNVARLMRAVIPDEIRFRTEELECLDYLGRCIGKHCRAAQEANEAFWRETHGKPELEPADKPKEPDPDEELFRLHDAYDAAEAECNRLLHKPFDTDEYKKDYPPAQEALHTAYRAFITRPALTLEGIQLKMRVPMEHARNNYPEGAIEVDPDVMNLFDDRTIYEIFRDLARLVGKS